MALIVFQPRYKGRRAMTVPADKAQTIYDNWQNPPDNLTDDQYDMLRCIEKIYFNTHGRAVTPDTSHMLHEGRLQGRSEMLPTGDR